MRDIVIVEADRERLDEVEPLWREMFSAHSAAWTTLEQVAALHHPEDAWNRRKNDLAQWLSDRDAFMLFAERAGVAVGVVFVRARRAELRSGQATR